MHHLHANDPSGDEDILHNAHTLCALICALNNNLIIMDVQVLRDVSVGRSALRARPHPRWASSIWCHCSFYYYTRFYPPKTVIDTVIRGVSKSSWHHPEVKEPETSFWSIHKTSLKSYYAKLHINPTCYWLSTDQNCYMGAWYWNSHS